MSKIFISICLIFFRKIVNSVDESFDNYADIILDNFFMKEFIILSYHCRGSLDLLIYNNFIKRK